ETGEIVHLHLHYQLTLGEKFLKGYQIPYSNTILSRRVFDYENNIFITSHEDEMWLLLLRTVLKIRTRDFIKEIFKKDVFGSSTIDEYKWLQEQIEIKELEKITKELFGINISKEIVNLINSDMHIHHYKKLRKLFIKQLKPFKSYSKLGGVYTRF